MSGSAKPLAIMYNSMIYGKNGHTPTHTLFRIRAAPLFSMELPLLNNGSLECSAHTFAVQAFNKQQVLCHTYSRDPGDNAQVAGSSKTLGMENTASIHQHNLRQEQHGVPNRILFSVQDLN